MEKLANRKKVDKFSKLSPSTTSTSLSNMVRRILPNEAMEDHQTETTRVS